MGTWTPLHSVLLESTQNVGTRIVLPANLVRMEATAGMETAAVWMDMKEKYVKQKQLSVTVTPVRMEGYVGIRWHIIYVSVPLVLQGLIVSLVMIQIQLQPLCLQLQQQNL